MSRPANNLSVSLRPFASGGVAPPRNSGAIPSSARLARRESPRPNLTGYLRDRTLVALLACAAGAYGQEVDAREIPRYSLTPFGGYTFGGEFNDEAGSLTVEVDDAAHGGVIFNIRESANTQWEIFYSRQSSVADTSEIAMASPAVDLDVQYLQIGGTYVADGDLARPFLGATIGAARFDPDPLTFDSENFFSFGIGAGWQFQTSERLGLRLEGRLLGTFLRSDTALFCETGPEENICAIAADSDLYWQFQTSLGVVFRF